MHAKITLQYARETRYIMNHTVLCSTSGIRNIDSIVISVSNWIIIASCITD